MNTYYKFCPKCYSAVYSNVSICPHCEHEFKVEATEMEKVNGSLKEFKNDFNFTVDFRNPEDCKNMSELYELAKNKGYKPGWAYFQGKNLGLI